MANAVAVATVSLPADNTQRYEYVSGTLAISADPAVYVTSGIICDLSNLAISQSPPKSVRVWSQTAAGTARANLYMYTFSPGTTQANGKVQIFTGAAAQTALTELTGGGAIPAGVSGDTIQFEAKFLRGI